MRPLRLDVEGFTCFRDRQEPLDFSGLSLFAIAGQTGAGKSSILDTMLYALYGEVPRIGRQGIGEFISHGRDALSVCLDFSVRGRTYRIVRRVKRRKGGSLQTTATLAELVAGSERSVADNVRPVSEAVLALLGLDFGAFTQTAILPQGEFARFLRAEPKGQRAILQHLLRHHVYERMREEAERRRGAMEGDLRLFVRELDRTQCATEESLAGKQAELADARARLERAAQERHEAEATLHELRCRRQLTEEAVRLRGERAVLAARELEIARARDELTLARRAAEIAPRLDVCRGAARKVTDAEERRVASAAALERVRREHSVAQAAAAAATDAAAACDALVDRIRRLDELKGDLAARRTLTAKVGRIAQELSVARERAGRAQRAREAAHAGVEHAEHVLQEARRGVESAGYDARLAGALEDLWTRAVQVRILDDEIARLEDQRATLDAAVEKASRDETAAIKAHARAAQAAAAADATLRAVAGVLDDARDRHHAALLRVHLHPGDSCPVCLQVVEAMPGAEPPPELRGLEEAHDAASVEQRHAAAGVQAADRKVAAAEARLTSAVTARDAVVATLRGRLEARDALVESIVSALALTTTLSDATEAISWIENRRAELKATREAHERAETRLRDAAADAHALQLALLRAEAEERSATEECARLRNDERVCGAELASVTGRIAAVSTHDDPAGERAELAFQVSSLRTRVDDARSALASLEHRLASASTQLVAADGAVAQAHADAAGARAALDDALRTAGFRSAEEAAAAVRAARRQEELESAIRTHERTQFAVVQRLLEIEPAIAGREVDAPALASAERCFAQVSDAWRELDRAVPRLEDEAARLADAVCRRIALMRDERSLRARLAVAAEMANDLKGDAFQEYLLEEAFRDLVAGASVRMREISNRYTLQWDAGDFYVVDHDNAGERRRAETLSGGETFMASLCLALQLSDEMLRTSGALQIDSLFIDEGFGTLDSDALAEVTDAMEALRQDGRLIGVISHRPELTDRLPGCVRIEKGAGESRWVLERVG